MKGSAGILIGGALCLCAGLIGGWLIWGSAPDPAVRAVEMLEKRCLPFLDEPSPRNVQGLDAITLDPGTDGFVDPETGLLLSYSATDCSVSDLLMPMQPDEAERAVSQAVALAGQIIPEALLLDDAAGAGFDLLTTLRHGSAPDQHPTFIASRFGADHGDDPANTATTLSFRRAQLGKL